MPEAEEVLQDVAWHTTVWVREMLQRRRSPAAAGQALQDVARRLDLLVTAVFGRPLALYVAEPPPPATLLTRVFREREGPRVSGAVPATDGDSIWLPAQWDDAQALPLVQWRLGALRMAMRAARGSPAAWARLGDPLQRAYALVLEAQAADAELVRRLPGMAVELSRLRLAALARRPPLEAFPPGRRRVELFLRRLAATDATDAVPMPLAQVLGLAQEQAQEQVRLNAHADGAAAAGRRLLYRDSWTGEFRAPGAAAAARAAEGPLAAAGEAPRTARLGRTPRVRQAPAQEDDAKPGAWMVQTSAPQQKAEDPAGLQRPADRDDCTSAPELADALAELPEARLVRTPGPAREVLLSDALPRASAGAAARPAAAPGSALRYPEWDWQLGAYRERAVQVHLRRAPEGPAEWVARTLQAHAGLLSVVRRRFDMLKAERVRLHRQLDGDDIDVDACVAARADFCAGLPMQQALYQARRRARRDMAVLLLADVSGSTDAWVAAGKRVVDVEREALLLVSVALQGLSERVALQSFSGEGPEGVSIGLLKGFDEPFDAAVGRRIAGLEPEHYTRAGAAVRHATATLLAQPARHRLLLLLSDGRPNDVDRYEGRYGIEDTRQSVVEAGMQGVSLFCLTVDRQGAAYLPQLFGPRQYALLPRPELLPAALLDWMRRLVRA